MQARSAPPAFEQPLPCRGHVQSGRPRPRGRRSASRQVRQLARCRDKQRFASRPRRCGVQVPMDAGRAAPMCARDRLFGPGGRVADALALSAAARAPSAHRWPDAAVLFHQDHPLHPPRTRCALSVSRASPGPAAAPRDRCAGSRSLLCETSSPRHLSLPPPTLSPDWQATTTGRSVAGI
jgi:hypothetical protein